MVKGLANIQSVALGIHHAVAITNTGIVYSWGRGINGQLGHGEIANEVLFLNGMQSIIILNKRIDQNQ